MKKYDIAAYIWPAYTGDDPRANIFWEEGIGEWQSVKSAKAKFDGHLWPRKPLWGYVNEANSDVMEMQINAAYDHGVNVFIYDWYWYDNRPFLENCLNDGYLKAKNNDKVKFYIMYSNHNANCLWNKRLSKDLKTVVWESKTTREQFEIIGKRLIEKYFHHPSYYTIDDKPVFMIYDIRNILESLGGTEATKLAFEWLREQAAKSGLKGLHIQTNLIGKVPNFSGIDSVGDQITPEIMSYIGIDSLTHYQICHYANPQQTYETISVEAVREWMQIEKNYPQTYFPHVSIGWDNNLRFSDLRPEILQNATPQNFKLLLEKAKNYIDKHPSIPPLITINSWNEWTEGSYLEPDDLYGYGFLDAIKETFLD